MRFLVVFVDVVASALMGIGLLCVVGVVLYTFAFIAGLVDVHTAISRVSVMGPLAVACVAGSYLGLRISDAIDERLGKHRT